MQKRRFNMPKRIGTNTIELTNKPHILGYACAVGKKEGEGPLGKYFDKIYTDEFCGEKSFEKAETHYKNPAYDRNHRPD